MSEDHTTRYWKSYFPWASPDQWECCKLLCDLEYGFHHIKTKHITPYGNGIRYYTRRDLATFDSDSLTRLVRLAHDLCIRASITAAGPGGLAICLFKRKREGRFYERHPTWDQIKSEVEQQQ